MAHTTSTEAQRAARRQADRDRLEQAARALLSSDGWQRWIRVRATNGLARYCLLISGPSASPSQRWCARTSATCR